MNWLFGSSAPPTLENAKANLDRAKAQLALDQHEYTEVLNRFIALYETRNQPATLFYGADGKALRDRLILAAKKVGKDVTEFLQMYQKEIEAYNIRRAQHMHDEIDSAVALKAKELGVPHPRNAPKKTGKK